MREPAHFIFVKQHLNWERARERLHRYRNIAAVFPLAELQKCSDKAPFYCHYLGWRLGTWNSEEWFELFDKLLEISTGLSGWDNGSRVPGGCEFEHFWGFVWELQTAVFFADHLGLRTEWKKAGPDIQVSVDSTTFFVECTTYRKSFGLEAFIGELFRCIDPQIITAHVPFLQFSLPKGKVLGTFLSALFEPYLDPSFLPGKTHEAQRQSPVMLPIPSTATNFYAYLENLDAPHQNTDLNQMLHTAGDPEAFLEIALKEIIDGKRKANDLSRNHPNLLMVNFLPGRDWQMARSLRPVPKPELGETLDGVLFCVCGIDRIPTFQSSFVHLRESHPMECLLEKSDDIEEKPPNNSCKRLG
jgi:hypothetical protein